MREFATPMTVSIPSTGSLADDVVANATDAPDAVAFSRRTEEDWSDVTAAEFMVQVTAAAKGLVAAGVEPGDRVALMSRTRYEWTLLDYAIWTAGAVTVPVYETSSAEQIAWIVADSGSEVLVAETAHALLTRSAWPPVSATRTSDPESATIQAICSGDEVS